MPLHGCYKYMKKSEANTKCVKYLTHFIGGMGHYLTTIIFFKREASFVFNLT
jgi:hypothetical protein